MSDQQQQQQQPQSQQPQQQQSQYYVKREGTEKYVVDAKGNKVTDRVFSDEEVNKLPTFKEPETKTCCGGNNACSDQKC